MDDYDYIYDTETYYLSTDPQTSLPCSNSNKIEKKQISFPDAKEYLLPKTMYSTRVHVTLHGKRYMPFKKAATTFRNAAGGAF